MKTIRFLFCMMLICLANDELRAQNCCPVPANAAAWWPGETSANDAVNLNHGMPLGDLGYAPGKCGQAFFFNGTSAGLRIPASTSLDIGAGGSFSLELWIAPSDVTQAHPLLQWNSPPLATSFGVSLWLSVPASNGGTGPGCLLLDVKNGGPQHHLARTDTGLVAASVWQHVAATYNGADGTATLYLNGSLVLQTNLGVIAPFTTQDLWIGCERDQIMGDKFYSIGNGQSWYAGLMDELSVYNRVLTPSEIAAIHQAGGSGKCAVPPTKAVIQPGSLSVAEGEAGTFTATASGSLPVSYQWQFNGSPLAGQTNITLALTNVPLTAAGNYSVVAANGSGTCTSAVAVLSVLASYAPTWVQTTAPSNLNWTAAATSADGKKLVAVAYDGSIYTSSDGGKTWVSNNVPKLTWYSVTSSADGNRLAAAAVTLATVGAPTGGVYVSTNAGATWQMSANGSYGYVIGSADGSKLMAVFYEDLYHLYTSTNGGGTWTRINSPGYRLSRFGCSADGNKLTGADVYDKIYTTTNFGATWTLTGAPSTNSWMQLAASADGSRLVAGAIYENSNGSTNARICYSTNSGATWATTTSPKQRWNTVASSSDGMKIVAGVNGGYLYVSTDGCASWTVTRAPSANWSSVASSADGTKLVAAMWPGGIYTWEPTALNIFTTTSNISLNWPTNVPGFVLQQRNDVSGAAWVNVTNVPVISGDQYLVELPRSADGAFFRLMYP